MDRLALPPVCDFGFYQRRKHGKWREVAPPDPALEHPVADSHAHLHMLPDPAWELARCAANGVDFLCMIVDPSEDGTRPFDEMAGWQTKAAARERQTVSIAVGVHPHNAKLYDDDIERKLLTRMSDPRVVALGEIGLDYHYDFSPRPAQTEVFRAQIRMAHELGLPISLHIREAHDEALRILDEEGFPQAGTLLHCFNLDAQTLAPWLARDCYVAFGGPLTFKASDDVREAARLVPRNRLLTETDAPYMTPEPMRGMVCGPQHTVYTADVLARTLGCESPEARAELLAQLMDNAKSLLDRAPLPWQRSSAKAE